MDIIDLIHILHNTGLQIIFVSGRSDICRNETIAWMQKHLSIQVDYLFMRKEGDRRKDDIVKYELLQREVLPWFYVQYWIDDRDRVVRMVRDVGIRCLQVADGNF